MPDGFFNVIKPTGMTSSDVVVKIRGILKRHYGEKIKVGHLGTLDPGGAGVLPVAVGRATRLFDYAGQTVKKYRAGFKFGVETDTLDSYGKITRTADKIPTIHEILHILPSFTGKIAQMPPVYSSISIAGKRAYDLARAGKEFVIEAREVEIFSVEFLYEKDGIFVFDITCSGGTYIRSVVRDMAYALGTVGYMSFIIRLRSGKFAMENAVTPDEIQADPERHMLPTEYFLSDYPRYDVPEILSEKVINGVKIKIGPLPDGFFTVYVRGSLLGIGIGRDGCLEVKTRLI